ncbi:MAG: hypothetical protein ACLRPF_08175, partial [Blautia sp.]|uniref:hypothetical protein n=1 Tax=Blautia sp. TaxID=1955243 RepID=UPI0039A13591
YHRRPSKTLFTEKVSHSLIFRLATLAYHRRILFTDFFSQSLELSYPHPSLNNILEPRNAYFTGFLGSFYVR